MTETVFQTLDLPVAERLDRWREVTSNALVSTETVHVGPGNFVAALRMVDLSAVQVTTMSLPQLRSSRTATHIRKSDPEQFQLAVPVCGRYRFSQAGRQVEIGPGDLMLYDSSRPFDSWTQPCVSNNCSVIMAQFPKRALPLPPDRVAPLTALRSSAGRGIGAVASSFIKELAGNREQFGAIDAIRLGTLTVDLLAAWCAHVLDAEYALPVESRERALLAEINSFIECHLADPGLSPGTVAAAHHISDRCLYRLFQRQGKTVAGWIRHRRLERCRHDLADPALRSSPVHAVAVRWGFTDKSQFSRLFRAAYGMSPRDYRHLH
ncbi:helix-turn-helix domain-containing protein [Amycolatopsis sp. Hca4]|uniref:AraC-like ligand-binding domain-containing protein n=1 Tax=Amycolatopsis sp. Hca4 TaxID=2742131 RepID=UPI00159161ED|nr:helix-turn-helix domain-containing protein [Amycolatopsis sp. Hca4]QKV74244.1 helix-turn-helix domain-containing protein [Amycolatopsis sp. Hca4]